MTRRPPRSTGTDTLLPYPTRCRSAAGFEVVDEDGGGGCIGAHFLGEVAQGARFGAQALERAIATEGHAGGRSEEHTSELQSLMRISYAVFCLHKQTRGQTHVL